LCLVVDEYVVDQELFHAWEQFVCDFVDLALDDDLDMHHHLEDQILEQFVETLQVVADVQTRVDQLLLVVQYLPDLLHVGQHLVQVAPLLTQHKQLSEGQTVFKAFGLEVTLDLLEVELLLVLVLAQFDQDISELFIATDLLDQLVHQILADRISEKVPFVGVHQRPVLENLQELQGMFDHLQETGFD